MKMSVEGVNAVGTNYFVPSMDNAQLGHLISPETSVFLSQSNGKSTRLKVF